MIYYIQDDGATETVHEQLEPWMEDSRIFMVPANRNPRLRRCTDSGKYLYMRYNPTNPNNEEEVYL